jgi:hypothetical protein
MPFSGIQKMLTGICDHSKIARQRCLPVVYVWIKSLAPYPDDEIQRYANVFDGDVRCRVVPERGT